MLLEARESIAPIRSTHSVRFPLLQGSAEVFTYASDVPPFLWVETFGDSYKDFKYYELIEETITDGFEYRYLVLSDERGEALALQPLVIAHQDLTETMPPFFQRMIEVIRQRFPGFLKAKMLLAGCLVGDGKLGLVNGTSEGWAAGALTEAVTNYADLEGVGLITLKDFSADKHSPLSRGFARTFTIIPSYPSLQLPLTFSSFEQYMEEKLSKVTRKSLRRKLRHTAQCDPAITMEVMTDCASVVDEIYPLYLQVAERSAVTFEVFTKAYFAEAGSRLGDRCRFFVWRRQGRAIAFSFCTVWDDTIYDHDIGLDYRVSSDLHLYHVTFRDLIEWALEEKLERYWTSPFSYDPKLRLKLELVPHDLYVLHTVRWVNFFMRKFAPYFAPAHTDPVLRRLRHNGKA